MAGRRPLKGRGGLARLRYEFDKSMAAGTAAMIAWLFVLSVAIVTVAAILIAIAGIQPVGADRMGFAEAFWQSLLRTLDSGTMSSDEGWAFRLLMLAVTITGLLIVATLIGVILTGLSGRLENLRKGRSLVLEEDHTIIFNWSETIFDVVAQLAIANESRRKPRIVIMADRDKADMEDEIAAKVPNLRNTKIICRSGDPTDLFDIEIANPQSCRSVIIMSPQMTDPDSRVLKCILTLVNSPTRREAPYRIAAEIRDSANADVARAVGGAEVQLLLGDDLISKIIVRSTRQPGLSRVYTELLDFEGCEIYAAEQPALEGKTFGEALHLYDTCTLVGLSDAGGKVRLNPPMDTVIAPGTKVFLIAEDDDRLESAPSPPPSTALRLGSKRRHDERPERTLLLGWNRRGPMVVTELACQVRCGSLLTIAADAPDIDKHLPAQSGADQQLRVELKRIDTCSRSDIAALEPFSYDHIIVLGYSDSMEVQSADTRTLVTLLHLRAIRDVAAKRVDIVSEIIDVRNVALAELADVDDLVVSNKLVSRLLTQASENEYFEAIFRDLLNDEGSEIALCPASDYVPVGETLTFHEVVRAASVRGETAIGHQLLQDGRGSRSDGLSVNPTKSQQVSYGPHDRIILLVSEQS